MSANRIASMGSVPIAIRKVFSGLKEPELQEEQLYREVIARAIMDAVGITGTRDDKEHVQIQKEALEWFEDGYVCEIYCDLAGVDFHTIRNSITERDENG